MELGNKYFTPSDELMKLSRDMFFELTGSIKEETTAQNVKILHNKILGVKPMDVIANE